MMTNNEKPIINTFKYLEDKAIIIKLIETNDLFCDINRELVKNKGYKAGKVFMRCMDISARASELFKMLVV